MDVYLARLVKWKTLGLVAISAMLHACSLPAVKPRVAPGFEEGEVQVKTLAVMPVDIGVTRENSGNLLLESSEKEAKLSQRMVHGLVEAFQRRGYLVQAVFQSEGRPDMRLMKEDDFAGLRVLIHRASRYSLIETETRLPEATTAWTKWLGETTHTDATVYARGWAYIDEDSGPGAGTVLAVLAVATVAFVLVAVLAAAVSKGKSRSKSKSRGRSKKHTYSAARSKHSIRPRRGSSGSKRPSGSPGRSAVAPQGKARGKVRGKARGKTRELAKGIHRTGQALLEAASEVDVRVGVYPPEEPLEIRALARDPEPEPQPEPQPVRTWTEVMDEEIKSCPFPLPDESTVGLTISLVHNQTGQVLWHAEQRFGIEADERKLQNLLEHFLKKMPEAPDPLPAAIHPAPAVPSQYEVTGSFRM
jgi:hypothetical protein